MFWLWETVNNAKRYSFILYPKFTEGYLAFVLCTAGHKKQGSFFFINIVALNNN